MDSITLPLWQLIGAVALPTVILIMLVTRLLGQKRRRKTGLACAENRLNPVAAGTYDQRIYQEMVSQQIDAVFNAFNAVIEAERIKLKALVLHQRQTLPSAKEIVQPRDSVLTEQAVQDQPTYHTLDHADEKDPAQDADGYTRISRNEAALAVMLRNKTEKKHQHLETVA